MSEPHDRKPSMTRREAWVYRIGLIAVTVYTVLGVYLLYYPSDALTSVFVVLLVVTLALGLLAGIVSIYAE